ncbi:hypothetical protein B0J12DRAFT_769135 [Macrophomina phaseolina]|uniref:Uncharacterized protein n=1 Tax=Macrophomina phaseolina TaxID=35725 RepID=A0ABQ8FVE4_9PEZI|nr:hypothetical protein B0J12DRAFT_769135 [Macrophomina phaseolina]
MVLPIHQTDEYQNMGNHVHSSDHSQQQEFSWLDLDDDATTMYDTSDADESDQDAEVPRRARAHHDTDRLPEAWCLEAERETPEPEVPLDVSPNTVAVARRAVQEPLCEAPSTPQTSAQQASFFEPQCIEEIVCALDIRWNFQQERPVYRKKVLETKSVHHTELPNLVKQDCLHMVWHDGKEIGKGGFQFDPLTQILQDFVVVAATEWSDWMPIKSEGFKDDRASHDWYQRQLMEADSS